MARCSYKLSLRDDNVKMLLPTLAMSMRAAMCVSKRRTLQNIRERADAAPLVAAPRVRLRPTRVRNTSPRAKRRCQSTTHLVSASSHRASSIIVV